MIDHIDGDRLNNAISNLRIATRAQNNRNVRPKKGGKSAYLGVYPAKNGAWTAGIAVNGKTLHLGTFECEECAARAYDVAALIVAKEYASLNFPPQNAVVADMLAGEWNP